MKKLKPVQEVIIGISGAVVIAVILFGLGALLLRGLLKLSVEEQTIDNSHFRTIEIATEESTGYNCEIIYDIKTKVKYVIFRDKTNRMAVTPLYNSDGSLQLYDEETDTELQSYEEIKEQQKSKSKNFVKPDRERRS